MPYLPFLPPLALLTRHAALLTSSNPGVMRFLQLEWHNHERARNAWDIERAEMKAKIAKQEGEVRSAKRLNEQLEKHVKMLENVVRNERAKNKAQAAGEKPPADQDKADVKGKERASPDLRRKRRCSETQGLMRILTCTCSHEQAPQLLPRHRPGSPRPARAGARSPARQVETIPHQMRRGDLVSLAAALPPSALPCSVPLPGEFDRFPEPQ